MAEFAVTDINSIIPLRDETSLEEAVALYVNPLSCLCMIDRCKKLNAKAVIITAAASQLGRMMIKYCMKEGITPIGTVRRQEQADMLKSELGAQYVFCSQDPDFGKQMKETAKALQATACLECIAGDTVGEMLSYMGFGSTLILYGSLSQTQAGNISPLLFLGLNQTMESFLLPYYLKELPPQQQMEFAMRSEKECTDMFRITINKRFGLH